MTGGLVRWRVKGDLASHGAGTARERVWHPRWGPKREKATSEIDAKDCSVWRVWSLGLVGQSTHLP